MAFESKDLKLTTDEMHKLDSILNGSGVDPAVYRAWIVQEGNDYFLIPQGIKNASEDNAVAAIVTLAKAALLAP